MSNVNYCSVEDLGVPNGIVEVRISIPAVSVCRVLPELVWLSNQYKALDIRTEPFKTSSSVLVCILFSVEEDTTELCELVNEAINAGKSLSYLYLMHKATEIKQIKKDISPVMDYIDSNGSDWFAGLYNFKVNEVNKTLPKSITEETTSVFHEVMADIL